MRLAVSVAAWSAGPDETFPPEGGGVSQALSSALRALGFTVLHLPVTELPAGLTAALAGVEATDTLFVHVAGVLAAGGSLEKGGSEVMPLEAVADAMADMPCGRALVFVEAAYRGAADALVAIEQVEAVADALSSNAGSHTTVIAVHPTTAEDAKLSFTHAVLEAARDVVQPDGDAFVAEAYAHAKERQVAGVASGFAFLRGGTPFPIGHRLPIVAASLATDPELAPTTSRAPSAPPASVRLPTPPPPPVSARAPTPPPPPPPVSARAPATVRAPATIRGHAPATALVAASAPAAAAAPVVVPAAPAVVTAPVAEVAPAAVAAPAVNAGSSGVWIEMSDVVDAPVPAAAPVAVPVPAPNAASSGAWLEMSDVVEAPSLETLDAQILAATAAGDHRAMVALSRERLPYLKTPEARVDELFEIGRTLVSKLHDLPEAVITLEEARGIDSAREDVLEALRRSYVRLERWTESLEVTLSLAKRATDPNERAGLRVAAADLACKHLSDDEYALELLTAALEDDATHESALEELIRIRRARGELVPLEQALTALAHRLVESGNAARAWDACQKLASLRRDDLGDAAGAVEALGIAKRLPLGELDSRAVLAEQLLALGDDDGAVAELEAIVSVQPEHVRAHARLFAIHHRAAHQDRAYLSALVLEELGGADAAARELLEAYRADWGLRARTALDESAWRVLRGDGSDEVIEAVFRAVLRAAVAAQLEDRGSPALDPARRQSESSTASIVRCFHWAARALGSPCPALYVLDGVDQVAGGIAAVAAKEPTTALGPDVLRGLSSKTLAFLAGRHLTYFRPEYQVLVHFPTAEAAAGLFFAAVEIVAPGTYVPPNLALRVASDKYRLARRLYPEELAALSAAVGRMEARDAKIDLLGWIRSVELTAGRAGLLLAGDLQTAIAHVRTEARGLSGMGIDERRGDLLAFTSSRAFAELRETYTDTTPSSTRPPTTESAVVHKDDPTLRESGERPNRTRLMA